MEDSRKEIPLGCAMNVAIIQDMVNHPAFINSCIKTPLKLGVTPPVPNQPWPFYNMSWSAYMMYCLFVVPKEMYNLPNDDKYYSSLVTKKVFRYFNVLIQEESFADNPVYHMKCLRDATSHVNFEITGSLVHLWNFYPSKKGNWHWEVKIDVNHFQSFLGQIADEQGKFYNEIKEGIRNKNGTQKAK